MQAAPDDGAEMTIHSDQERGTARSEGPSVQDILRAEADTQAIPPVLLEESNRFLGDEALPIERYISQEFHDREVEKVWRKVWQAACRVEDLPESGDVLTYEIAEDSI